MPSDPSPSPEVPGFDLDELSRELRNAYYAAPAGDDLRQALHQINLNDADGHRARKLVIEWVLTAALRLDDPERKLLEAARALRLMGSSRRADDPECVWVRFMQDDWDRFRDALLREVGDG